MPSLLRNRKFLILHRAMARHDAIGNDIFAMGQILAEDNEVFYFAEVFNADKDLNFLDLEKVKTFLHDPSCTLIYHHSIYWELGETLLAQARGPIIFKYHNITPGLYFKSYCLASYQSCELGRQQTQRFMKLHPEAYWMCDSAYNASDLGAYKNKGVVPPFHQVSDWENLSPDPFFFEKLKNNKRLKILFTGRLAPNKGHKKIIQLLKKYAYGYSADLEVYFVGKCYTPKYLHEVMMEIYASGLLRHLHIIGELSKSHLMALYKACDIFLCLSEHEGFCVPLIEAQALELPLVASKIPAVAETMGPEQICLDYDLDELASALYFLRHNSPEKYYLQQSGRQNYLSRFTFPVIKNQFLTTLGNL